MRVPAIGLPLSTHDKTTARALTRSSNFYGPLALWIRGAVDVSPSMTGRSGQVAVKLAYGTRRSAPQLPSGRNRLPDERLCLYSALIVRVLLWAMRHSAD